MKRRAEEVLAADLVKRNVDDLLEHDDVSMPASADGIYPHAAVTATH